jgi:hypothetical protein
MPQTGRAQMGPVTNTTVQKTSERYLNHILSASGDCGKLGA